MKKSKSPSKKVSLPTTYPHKGLISRIYNRLNKSKKKSHNQKWVMILNRKFSKEETKMSKKISQKKMFKHSQQLGKCKFKQLWDFILLQSEKHTSTNKGQQNAGGDARRENTHSLFVV